MTTMTTTHDNRRFAQSRQQARADLLTATFDSCEAVAGTPHFRVASPIAGGREAVVIEARFEPNWLRLESSPLEAALSEQLMLEANGLFDGGARLAVTAGDRRLHAVADIPLRKGVSINGAIRRAGYGLEAAARTFSGIQGVRDGAAHGNGEPDRLLERLCSLRRDHAGGPLAQEQGRSDSDALVEAIEQSPWRVQFADGSGSGRRGLLGDRQDCVVVSADDGEITLRSENLVPRLSDNTCRGALACYLVEVSRSLRMVRPIGWQAGDAEDGQGCAFELRLYAAPSSGLIDELLSTMSAALGYCRRELSLLAVSPRAAAAYLDCRRGLRAGPAAVPCASDEREVEGVEDAGGRRLPEPSSVMPAA